MSQQTSALTPSGETSRLTASFTIHSWNEIIDYVGGRDDIERGVIRAIGDPHARFGEDCLRLLRCVRFAARFGFSIEEPTRRALSAFAEGIESIAAERVEDELTGC